MAAIEIGTVTIADGRVAVDYTDLDGTGETALEAGTYPVLSTTQGAFARVPGTRIEGGKAVVVAVGFGLNATCTAFVARLADGLGLMVDLDPAYRIGSFYYAPGRVGYRVVDAVTREPIHPSQAAVGR